MGFLSFIKKAAEHTGYAIKKAAYVGHAIKRVVGQVNDLSGGLLGQGLDTLAASQPEFGAVYGGVKAGFNRLLDYTDTAADYLSSVNATDKTAAYHDQATHGHAGIQAASSKLKKQRGYKVGRRKVRVQGPG